MRNYMRAFSRRVKEAKETVREFKEVVWLAEKCERALIEDVNAVFFGEKEASSAHKIISDFSQLAFEEYNMSSENFIKLKEAISFLNSEGLEYC